MVELGTYKMAGGLMALLFFVYSITNWIDKTVIAGDETQSKNTNYLIGLVYLITSLMIAYVTFF
jgi:hypothetical protein